MSIHCIHWTFLGVACERGCREGEGRGREGEREREGNRGRERLLYGCKIAVLHR